MGTLLADPQPDTAPTADRNTVRQAIERLVKVAGLKRQMVANYKRIDGTEAVNTKKESK